MNDRCPRCGGSFHCGVADPGPCACTTLELDAATLGALRARYIGCLCLTCLRELAQRASDSNNPANAQAPISGTTPSL